MPRPPEPDARAHRRVPGLVHRTFRGTTEVLAPDERMTRLDGAASAVWSVLDRARTNAEVAAAIERQSGARIDPASVQVALDLLEEAGVVVVDPAVGP